ncbi:MAG: Photosystem I assembly protein Ycf3 [Bacteroidia bacterium]|nr:Photosystem I assembly protein Ycf3 [Bacteroidia bacterium]
MKKTPFCLLVNLFFLHSFICAAQNHPVIDSLQTLLGKASEDTNKAFLLTELAWEQLMTGDFNGSLQSADNALLLSEKLNYKWGIATAYNRRAGALEEFGNYSEALKSYEMALTLFSEMNNKKGMASGYNNIALIYRNQGDFSKALECYLNALRIREELNDKKGIGSIYNNIAVLYSEQGKPVEALKNYELAARMREEIGDKRGLATTYGNMGIAYKELGNYEQALKYQFQSLSLSKEMGNKQGIGLSYSSIGVVYAIQKKYSEALKYQLMSLNIHKEIGDKKNVSSVYIDISKIYLAQQKNSEAQLYADSALQLAKEIGHLFFIKDSYKTLSEVDSARGNPVLALKHFKLYTLYKDSLLNEESSKQMAQLKTIYETEKKDNEINLLNKDKQLQQKEISRQKTVRNGFIAGFVFVLLFAVIFFTQRNRISKEKKRSEELLLNILPEEVADELKEKGRADAKLIDEVTVLFTDFKGFTALSEKLSPQELVKDLNECFSAFDLIMEKYGMEKIKTIGDSYMAAGGLPTPNTTHATDAIKAAIEMRDFIAQGKAAKIAAGLPYFEIRIGIHTGPVVAGIVGVKKFQYDIWGDTVNTASRMESSSEPGKINISETTYHLVKDIPIGTGINFEYRGEIEAKGKGKVKMYFVS